MIKIVSTIISCLSHWSGNNRLRCVCTGRYDYFLRANSWGAYFNNWKHQLSGRLLLQLLRHDIACYATGSSFDKCKGGSADWLASRLELSGVYITQPQASYAGMEDTVCQGGKGRIGYYKKEKSHLRNLQTWSVIYFRWKGSMHISQKRDDGLTFSDVAVVVWGRWKEYRCCYGTRRSIDCYLRRKQ